MTDEMTGEMTDDGAGPGARGAMSDNGAEFVARPPLRQHKRERYAYDAILATAQNGQAVRIPLVGLKVSTDTAIRGWLARRGYTVHIVDTKDGYLTVWAERRQ